MVCGDVWWFVLLRGSVQCKRESNHWAENEIRYLYYEREVIVMYSALYSIFYKPIYLIIEGEDVHSVHSFLVFVIAVIEGGNQ